MRRLWSSGHVHAFAAGGLFVFMLADIALRDWPRAAISAVLGLFCALVAVNDSRTVRSGQRPNVSECHHDTVDENWRCLACGALVGEGLRRSLAMLGRNDSEEKAK